MAGFSPFRKKSSLREDMGITKKYMASSVSLSLMVTAFWLVLLTLYGIANRSLDFSSFRPFYFLYYVLFWVPVQELFFRGFLQSRLYRLGNKFAAVIVTAVIFSLTHFMFDIQLVLFTLPAGLAWGFIMWKRPNILGPIISHAILGQYLLQFVV
jgi:hypothetical protein